MKTIALGQLQTFLDVVELGTFSAAADKASLTQPAVSQQIRQLEQYFGVRLLERVGKRVRPTPAGNTLLAGAERIQEEFAETLDALQPHKSGITGQVRIGTGATPCIFTLPDILRQVKRDFPGIDLLVHTGNAPEIHGMLMRNELDVAVVMLPVPSRSVEIIDLCQEEMVLVLPSGAAQPKGKVTPASLVDIPLILHEAKSNTRTVVDQWFLAAQQHARITMELGSVEAIKQLVKAGLGWSILPKSSVIQAPAETDFTYASLAPKLIRRMGLVLRLDKRMSPALRRVVTAMEAGFTDVL